MKRLFPAILIILAYGFAADTLHAQPGRGGGRVPGGTISGTILADETGEGVPGATVAVFKVSDSTLATGVVGGTNGEFVIQGLMPGAYYLKVTSLGFEMQIIPDVTLSAGSMRVDLGEIRMAEDASSASEDVTVSAERSDIEFRSDRTVYNVENQPVTSGGNVIDVLKNVPQVEVDINDNVSLRGSQNVAVMINNRPVPLSGDALAGYLKGLPADMVKSVEIIPNPSAKHDPDGMAGILNIVLKDKREEGGVSGTVNLGVGSNNSFNSTGSLNVRTGKLNLFSSYSFRYDEGKSSGSTYRENLLLDPVTILEQTSTGEQISRSHTFNTNLDYGFDDHNSVSLSAVLSRNGSNSYGSNLYSLREAGEADPIVTERFTPSDGDRNSENFSAGYRWVKEASRHEFSVDASYNRFGFGNDGSYVERLQGEIGITDSVVERQATNSDNNNYEVSARADYVRPIGENGRMETGYKWEFERINSDFYSETFNPTTGNFVPDVNLNNEATYDQQLHSIYGIYGHTFGALDLQFGLRAEQASTKFDLLTTSEIFEKDYFSLFPSGSASYSIGQGTRLRASYSRRITRPRFWNLNPFPQYEDRLNLRRGNPYLDPEYTDAYELGFNQFFPWGSLSVSPYYRYQTDQIGRWLEVDSNGVSTLTFENFQTSETYGAEIVGTYRLRDRLSAFVNLSLYQTDLDGSNVDEELSNDAFGWSARANVNWTIIDGLDMQTSYFYRGRIGLPGGEIKPMHSADLAVKKSLFSDRASLTLRVSDPFDTRKFELSRSDRNYYTANVWEWQSREVSLNFSWNFGQQDRNANRRRPRRDDSDGGQSSGPPAGIGF